MRSSFFGNLIGQKAVAAHRKQQYDDALKLYREAEAKGMNNFVMLKNYAALLIRKGFFDEALPVLERCDRAPGLQSAERTDLLVNYAIILWKKGHLEHAVEVLQKQLENHRTGNLYSVLGYLLIEQGNAEKTLSFCEEALDYDETDPIFLDNIGQVYMRLLKDPRKAKPYFEKAIEQKPDAIDSNYLLALIETEEGKKDQARKRLEIAKKGNFTPLNYATPERIEEALRSL